MGGRLSMPRGPDGMNEASKPTSSSPLARLTRGRGRINGRTIMAPLAAFTMAGILFVYARTSIRAAKLNAQNHRLADGGQISWHKESLRRHGQLDQVGDDRSNIKEALRSDLWKKKKHDGQENSGGDGKPRRSTDEAQLRKMLGKKD